MLDCSDITFVLASRNDGYACVNQDWQQEQIKKIENCIYSSEKTFLNRKFILLDYNPPKNTKQLKEIFTQYKNLKIITLSEDLQKDLDNDNKNGKINFYEFVAKHIGSLFVNTKYIIFINQDLIFPQENSELLVNSLRMGEINLAFRCKVDYSLVNLPVDYVYNVCHSPFKPQIKVYDIYGNGDFLGIEKDKYNKIGGYLLSHQNWAVDNEILYRLGLDNMHPITMKKGVINKIVRNYFAISLDHPEDPIGASRKRDENYMLISNNIIKNLKNYVIDIFECK